MVMFSSFSCASLVCPWIHDANVQICEVPDVTGCELGAARDRNPGDQGVSHIDRSSNSFAFGRQDARGFGREAVNGDDAPCEVFRNQRIEGCIEPASVSPPGSSLEPETNLEDGDGRSPDLGRFEAIEPTNDRFVGTSLMSAESTFVSRRITR
jgi:hypothetical protein